MASYGTPKRFNALIKGLVAVGMAMVLLPFSFSCDTNRGTGSASSAGGGSGTGTGWNIILIIGDNYLPLQGETPVTAIVKDSAGAPAPQGTQICFTAIKGDFLVPGSADGYATVCETTTNNLGTATKTYRATEIGRDTVFVSSQGVIKGDEIVVYDPDS